MVYIPITKSFKEKFEKGLCDDFPEYFYQPIACWLLENGFFRMREFRVGEFGMGEFRVYKAGKFGFPSIGGVFNGIFLLCDFQTL